jgi:hypothetical protein
LLDYEPRKNLKYSKYKPTIISLITVFSNFIDVITKMPLKMLLYTLSPSESGMAKLM